MAASPTSSRSAQMMEKGLTVKTGQTHVQRYTKPLLELIEKGELDTTFMISHREPLERRGRDVPEVARRAGHLHQDRPQAGHGQQQSQVDLVAARPGRPAE
jgi:threonine dehydrogenase-like Zn-dependent dehydrogenase